MNQSIENQIDHLFRHQSGQIVSTLTRLFGSNNIDLAESVVQEALIKAFQSWPLQGIPDNPAGWLMQVAKNQALDAIRRDKNFQDKESEVIYWLEQHSSNESDFDRVGFETELRDDQLKMIFTCCHPVLATNAQIALTLKTLCGLSVGEIARAFLTSEETIAQRIVRAKQKIKDEKIPYEVPAADELPKHLDPVLNVLYLLFNEGYSAHQGDELIRRDLCQEAIRLCSLLASQKLTRSSKTHALLSIMLFQASRFEARTNSDGEVLLLSEQDRSLWDQKMIRMGVENLDLAMGGSELSEFHLQAGIAACHALAKTYEETNWEQVVFFYDKLVAMNPSPVLGLNRAVAIAMLEGAAAGIEELESLKDHAALKAYYLLPAAYGELHGRLGDKEKAHHYFNEALKLVGNEPERRYLIRKTKEFKN